MVRAATLLLLLAATPAFAQTTPVGLWRTVDDHTGQATGVVRIFEQSGHLYGNIQQVFDPAKARAQCGYCKDDRHNQPVLGLQIIRGLKADGATWDGGQILDPETGDTYRCSMRLAQGGQSLVVRGFLGISLFGRSQTWTRVPG